MLIRLYQDDLECYFWTREDIETIRKNNPENLKFISYVIDELGTTDNSLDFNIGDNEFVIIPNMFRKQEVTSNLSKHTTLLTKDGINVIVFTPSNNHSISGRDGAIFKFLDELNILQNAGYKFILIQKLEEDFFMWEEGRSDTMVLDLIGGMKNVLIFTDSVYNDRPNFIFHPKMHIQNWHNNQKFDSIMFEEGHTIFHNIKKEYRMGLHINRINKPDRRYLDNNLGEGYHPNLLYTSKLSRINDIYYNKFYDVFDIKTGGFDTSNFWYTKQFLEMTTKSEMELIYETFTIIESTGNIPETIKWNEKTVKQLFLGKPFIHTDPVAHSLLDKNGFKPYRSLFTDELWEYYQTFDITTILNSSEEYWYAELHRNIDWLLNMDEVEWRERIAEANEVGKWNANRCKELIYNTSLLDYIPKEFLQWN